MADVRQRKPVAQPVAAQKQEEEDKSKLKKRHDAGVDLEPNIFVVAGLFLLFSTFLGTIFWYKVDNREGGAFAAWVNKNLPVVDRALNRPSTPMFGASAAETTGELKLTEEELKPFDGSDPDKPIYLAINGTIFDVSISPAFYGPGGHYNHFTGKDATRAWITECWDEPEQFTWRLDNVEVMFMNKWLDEQIEAAGKGEFDDSMSGLASFPKDMLKEMAEKTLRNYGRVTEKQKEKRRKKDPVIAKKKVQETLDHWYGFFAGNDKYKIVGTVIREEKPEPPAPCEAAMKKRPMKGGRLQKLMDSDSGNMMANMFAPKKDGKPDFVQDAIKNAMKKKDEAKEKASDAKDAVKEKVMDTKDKVKEKVEEVVQSADDDDDEEDLVHEEL